MATILHLMGPTCAGKSTLLKRLAELGGERVGTVEIGKLLRAKYGEAYFQGQAAPERTKAEALDLYLDTIRQHIADGKKLIVVDGQPRDLSQAEIMTRVWLPKNRVKYLLVHATHEDREARARAGRQPGPDLDLALARLHNDYQNNYVVMTYLIEHGSTIEVVNTSRADFNGERWCDEIIRRYA